MHIKTENLKQDLVKQEQSEPERKLAGVVQQMVVTSSQLWKPVQDMVKDTVVQIFSQIAAIDILQPYKTPSQGAAYGSGFY